MNTKQIVTAVVAVTIVGAGIYSQAVEHNNKPVRTHTTKYIRPVISSSSHTETQASSSQTATSFQQKAEQARQVVVSQLPQGKYTYSGGSFEYQTDNGLNANITSAPYVTLSQTDTLGRTGRADAWLNKTTRQTMTRDKTGNSTTIKPVGWHQAKIGHTFAYNRGHLIGYALAGKLPRNRFDASESNRENIMTQTYWANQKSSSFERGQLYYETLVRKALDSNKRVRYRVTPIYQGNELVARGTLLQAKSSDNTLNFNAYVPNIAPEFNIDYATGFVK